MGFSATWVGFTLFRAPNTPNSSLYSSPLLGSALPFFALQSLHTPVYILLRYLGRLYSFSRSNHFKLQSIFFSATWVGFTLFRAPITSNSSLYSSPILGSALPFFALQSLQTPV